MKISVIGLGKLGLPMAAWFAKHYDRVIGIDNNSNIVNNLWTDKCPVWEVGLKELLAEVSGCLKVTQDYGQVINTDATFIIVPTPSGDDYRFKNDYVIEALRKLGSVLKAKRGYHLVVLTSTVMPGSMERELAPELEEYSGKKCGVDFGFCYSPEFVALGSVVSMMENPDVVLIGESDEKAGEMLASIYSDSCTNSPPICRMSWWNAEVAKLMLNVFVTTKISLANTFAQVCEKIPGGDIDAVTEFLGYDRRIGHKFFKGGLGFGGPCFPRDNRAFSVMAEELRIATPLQHITESFNRMHDSKVAERAMDIIGLPLHSKVASVLGVTYKPGTDVIEESSAVKIALYLAAKGIDVRVYDPAGLKNVLRENGGDFTLESSVEGCLQGSDLCIVATQWDEFKNLPPQAFSGMRTPRVLDCWRILDKTVLEAAGVDYYAVGINKQRYDKYATVL